MLNISPKKAGRAMGLQGSPPFIGAIYCWELFPTFKVHLFQKERIEILAIGKPFSKL